ncbi:MAG: hypothetical protein IJ224_01030 [Lachnospiraceae bacterium]|nr:hypothetical protein [Lachnospiraceae bacterium]
MKKDFSKSKLYGALAIMLGMGIWGSVISTDTLTFKDISKTDALYSMSGRIELEGSSVVVDSEDSEQSTFFIPDLQVCYDTYKEVNYSGKKYLDEAQNKVSFEQQRKEYLAKEEERMLEKTGVSSTPVAVAQPQYNYYTEDGLTASGGVNYYGDQKETYYNLNMNNVVNNAQNAGIEGDYWVRDDGVKMYGEYVIIAANQEVHPYGTTVDTSLGEGIVLDTGTFATNNPTQVDIATEW